ncbi:MAG: carboxypeptidase regulatory-like domain-containing protein [Nocardioidaceae bacterium]
MVATLSCCLLGFQSTAFAGGAATGPAAGNPGKADNVRPLCSFAQSGHARCFALVRTDNKSKSGHGLLPNDTTPAGYGPSDLASAYQIQPNGGAGITVAIVDAYDDPNAEADLAMYRQQFGLPACTTANGCFSKVNQDGNASPLPTPDAGWAGEISLDLDMVSAAAPNAHILLVEGNSNSFADLAASVDTAVNLGAKVVSNSYGSNGEDPGESAYNSSYDHPGVAITVSTGDGGYFGDGNGTAFPSNSPHVIAVGGTSLTPDSSARGWNETVWNDAYGATGSGCSLFQTKPSWQTDTGCANRTSADVSSDADPATGVSVYDTFSAPGWQVYGGTSAAAPLIGGLYATAGGPVAGTEPGSYPYDKPGAFNDVTSGNDGSCSVSYLCTAATGYDGPTGLGTPAGVTGFQTGPHGVVAGTVTSSATNAPVAGATVTAGSASAVTATDGSYTMTIPVGTYDVTASAFGYATQTINGVVVTDGGTVSESFALDPVPSSTVSGVVRDGDGHNWPLYAQIQVQGSPNAPVWTNPYTGAYQVNLPQGADYTLHVSSAIPGYVPQDKTVTVGSSDVTANVDMPVDRANLTAPGYRIDQQGTPQTFDGTSAPAGWTTDLGTGTTGWVFDDPGSRGNLTGGTGGFAIVDSDHDGTSATQDATLTSPTYDLSSSANPNLEFKTDYKPFIDTSTATVQVSTDGGTTWTEVWTADQNQVGPNATIDVPLPMAANQSNVRVRFHYTGSFSYYWEIDDVVVGQRALVADHGGLVEGIVTDTLHGQPQVGAKVTSVDKPADSGVTASTPDDPDVADAFYWMFSSLTGKHDFTASKSGYQSDTEQANVITNSVTRRPFGLAAGELAVRPGSISKTLPWKGHTSTTLHVTNTGNAPASLKVDEQPGAFQILGRHGAVLNRVKTSVTMHRALVKGAHHKVAATRSTTPSDSTWTSIADFPTTIQDNAADYSGGKLYSAFGYDGNADSAGAYSFDPGTGAWTKLASAADTRESPAHGFINGKWYIAGGWGGDGNPDAKTEVYDPSSDSWSTAASMPTPYAGSGTAVLGGKLYAVGGCTASSCGTTDAQVYNPSSDSWAKIANYPEAVSWEACGGIGAKLYCSGGTTDAGTITHAYVYDPSSDSWSAIADQPTDQWGTSYTAANNLLLISGGAVNNSAAITNEGYAYDPSTDAWKALPNANQSTYRGGGALGFYRVGGGQGGFSPPVSTSEVLPGFSQGGSSDVKWLKESPTTVTLAPGASKTITVTLNAASSDITQPGTYTAQLTYETDTPFSLPATDVTMKVNPPKSWGKITGLVKGALQGGGSAPLPGATVQIDGRHASWTFKTDAGGGYALWLAANNSPLTVIVAKDGFKPQVKTVRITRGKTTRVNWVLQRS